MYRSHLLILVGLILLSGCGSSTDKLDPSQAPSQDIWVPDLDEDVGQLRAIDVVGPDDVWVAGSTGAHIIDGRRETQPKGLIAHWNGKDWSVEHRIGDGSFEYDFQDIDAASPDDVWAVGKYVESIGSGTTDYGPLVAHWNGKEWKSENVPALHELTNVEALAPDNVWVGGFELIHWDGSSWTVVDIPQGDSGYGGISDFEAISASDIWATSGSNILHWNGKEWTVSYRGEDPGDPNPSWPIQFEKIVATGTDDVWALGAINIPTGSGGYYSYVYHWNGREWSEQEGIGAHGGPSFVGSFIVSSIYAAAPDRVWLLAGFQGIEELIQWDGTNWSHFACPAQGSSLMNYSWQDLNEIAEVGEGQIWALGNYQVRQDDESLMGSRDWLSRGSIIQAYMGICLPPTPTQVWIPPTLPPATPTARPLYAPEEFPTVPLPAPSGVVPIPTGVTP